MRSDRAWILGLSVAAMLAFGHSAADAGAAFRLRSPKANAPVSKPPLLRWSAAPGARNYNVQVWRGNHKILSRWPDGTRLQIHARWHYKGRVYRLIPARYRWYVWPAYSWGYGAFRSRAFIVGRVPGNTAPPLVSGEPREGESLSATTGEWTGTAPLRFSYAWQRCEADSSSCGAIAGATSSSLTLGALDIDDAVRVVVTATNLAGARTAPSARTAVVLAAPPMNLSKPRLAGSFQQGRVIAAVVGSWQSSRPLTFSFHWERCDRAGSACQRIRAARVAGYLVRSADFKRRVRVLVQAANSGGTRVAAVLSPVVGRVIVGTPGSDVLSGSIGADLIRARDGDDRIFAGSGNDRAIGGSGKDFLYAGSGNDVLRARDGRVDFVACGVGKDVAIVDRRDHVRSCETVDRG
jgi:RTX calcium-binding nonapeptide repeat (4 copies)